MDATRGERSLGDLFSELSQQTSALIRQEVALARTELTRSVTDSARDAAFVAVGGAVLYAAVLGLMAMLVLVLMRFGVDGWLAAAIAAVVFGITGFVLVRSHLQSLKRRQVAPVQTIDSIKETAQWLKNETR